MKSDINKRFSQLKNDFHGLALPEPKMILAGYSALIDVYELEVPLPFLCAVISSKHKRYNVDRWSVYTPRYLPDASLSGHLFFALKHEPIDLAVLHALFECIKPKEVVELIVAEPTGKHSRRLWFLYEWLTQKKLSIPDASGVSNLVEVINSKFQYPGPGTPSKRHRVQNNLPGVYDFCPLIRRTEYLDHVINGHLDQKIIDDIGKIHPDIISRAAAFVLLKDSKASYAIEGEKPATSRAQRWGKAIGKAGMKPLSEDELLRLQKLVIEDQRFVHMGWRTEGGFVGVHDRSSNAPMPDHISARFDDVKSLIEGLVATNDKLRQSDFDPVLQAALISFGFIFIHPFEDGNGRIHRYLIHHVLSERHFSPPGIIFPVSAVILENIQEYKKVLEEYSLPRLSLIQWEATKSGNVIVTNQTKNLYRFFDATSQAEFLYKCVHQTVETTLPEEVRYLEKHDQIKTFLTEQFDMSDRKMELLIGFLRQNNGKFSKRALSKEFSQLSDKEISSIEWKYKDLFL